MVRPKVKRPEVRRAKALNTTVRLQYSQPSKVSEVEDWLNQLEPSSTAPMPKKHPTSGQQPLRRSPRFQAPIPRMVLEIASLPEVSTVTSTSNHDPTFRQTLKLHKIEFDNIRRRLPQGLLNLAVDIAYLPRDPEHWKTTDIMKQIDPLADEEEFEIQDKLNQILFPQLEDLQIISGKQIISPLKRSGNLLIRSEPGIGQTKPDLVFGYTLEALLPETSLAKTISQHFILGPLLKSSSSKLYCPFLTVEYKSQSRSGTFWHGANQNTISTSSFVNAIEQLHRFAGSKAQPDNIAFSLTIDGSSASLYLHWYEAAGKGVKDTTIQDAADLPKVPGGTTSVQAEECFICSNIANFHWVLDSDILACRRAIRGILDYGMTVRLGKLRTLLQGIAKDL